MEEILLVSEESMEKTLQFLKKDLASVNTGRATPDLLNTIKVDSYGNIVPLKQVSSISVPEPTTLAVQVWDKAMVSVVEKAIINSNLGFNPKVDGQILRINVPKLTEERRKEFCKLVKKYGEDKKIIIRNIRRDALVDIKKEKDNYSEDEVKDFNDDIQDLTDKYVKKIDELIVVKEKDIMTI